MKTFALLVACLTPCIAVMARDASSAPKREVLLEFDGYMKSSSSLWLAVSLAKPDGSVAARAWLTTGQSMAGYELVAFDERHEILSVRDASGRTHQLHLPASKVRDAPEASTAAPDGFARAMVELGEFFSRLRKQWSEPVE